MEFNVPSNQLVTMPIIKCLGQYSLYFCVPSHGITTLSILYVASDLVFMATPSHSPPLPKMLYKPFSLSQYYSPFLSIVHVKEGEIDQEKWGASSFARTCFFCWLWSWSRSWWSSWPRLSKTGVQMVLMWKLSESLLILLIGSKWWN